MDAKFPFEKQQFLKSGAVFARGNWVWLMWEPGELEAHSLGLKIGRIDFFMERKWQWIHYRCFIKLHRSQALGLFKPEQQERSWRPASFDKFQRQFDWSQEQFSKSAVNKTVPYVFESSLESPSSRELESWISNGLQNEKGYLYGQWDGQSGVIGLTPERLFYGNPASRLETMALAGTTGLNDYKANPRRFENDHKELQEHGWVVSDLEKQMGTWSFEKKPMEVLETPHLAHMKTQFYFEPPPDITCEELVRRFHPTPALGVSPRQHWSSVMKQFYQWEPRTYFGAPFVFVDEEACLDALVGIRNLIWNEKETFLGSGCGVVQESQLEKEWQELSEKRQSVKGIFGLL